MSEALQAALGERYDALTTSLRDRVVNFVLAAFDSLGDYHDEDAAAFAERVLPVVLGAQAQMGALTDAYLSTVIADMLGGAAATPTGADELPEALRGVPPAEVYRRPFVTTWSALAAGKSFTESLSEGRARLLSITETDMQLARTRSAQRTLRRGGTQFYRRRLSGGGNCGLCVIAATQRYRVERLMPIHPGCDCKVEPLAGSRDPGQIIDRALLEEAHDAIAQTTGTVDRGGRAPDYRDLIITREHGELGPLLAVRRHDFTGPRDVPAP